MPLSRHHFGSIATQTFLAALVLLWLGRATGWFALSAALELAPASVWRGQLWRIFTAPLLANGPLDLVFNGIALVWLSGVVERFWRPREWLLYLALCAGLAGLTACTLFPREDVIPEGPAPLVLALLVAYARLAPHERMQFSATFSLSMPMAVAAAAGLMLMMALATGMPFSGLVTLLANAVTGWLYLSIRWRVLHRQSARPVASRRFGHLEL